MNIHEWNQLLIQLNPTTCMKECATCKKSFRDIEKEGRGEEEIRMEFVPTKTPCGGQHLYYCDGCKSTPSDTNIPDTK